MSSRRALRRRRCSDKQCHLTISDAHRHIAGLQRVHGKQEHLVPYRCPHCGGYHVGHPTDYEEIRPHHR